MQLRSKTYPGSATSPDLGPEEVAGEIRIEAQGLWFDHPLGGLGLPFSRLQIEREPDDRIRFTDPEQPEWVLFTTAAEVLVHPMLLRHNPLRAQIRDLNQRREGRRMLRLTGWFLVVVLGIGLALAVAGSLATRILLRQIPVSYEVELGQKALATLGNHLDVVTNEVQLLELERIAGVLAKGLPPHAYRFTFQLVDAPWPNAVALPGGYILVTTGLLESAASPEEVAGVIAHEMAHVLRRHGLRRQIAAAGPHYAMRALIRDRQSLLTALAGGSELLLTQSFSRDYEREADRSGWNYLVNARIDPRGLAGLLRRLRTGEERGARGTAAVDPTPTFLRSHPTDDERLVYLDALWENSTVKSGFVPLQPAAGR